MNTAHIFDVRHALVTGATTCVNASDGTCGIEIPCADSDIVILRFTNAAELRGWLNRFNTIVAHKELR